MYHYVRAEIRRKRWHSKFSRDRGPLVALLPSFLPSFLLFVSQSQTSSDLDLDVYFHIDRDRDFDPTLDFDGGIDREVSLDLDADLDLTLSLTSILTPHLLTWFPHDATSRSALP